MTKQWIVRLEGEAYENYVVEADTEEEAKDRWMHGHSQGVYAMGMDVVSARLDEDQNED